MSKVIAFSFPELGHVSVVIPTLFELRERGHDVLLATYRNEASGGDLGGIRVRGVSATGGAAVAAYAAAVGAVCDRARGDLFERSGEPIARALEQLIEEERPEVMLVDSAMWGGAIAAEASGLRWARVASNPLQFRGRCVDVRGPGLPPPRGILGRLRNTVVQAAQYSYDRLRLPVVNAVRVRRGLAPWTHPWELFEAAPLTLAYTAEPFEYPRDDWPPTLRFVGPALWEAPASPPEWLEALDDRPLALVVETSIAPSIHAVELPIEAILAGLVGAGYQVIVTAPTGRLLTCPSPHVWVARYVPHQLVLPRAACVVCHGGAGIVHKALSVGVPVVAIPTGYDRAEIARRVEVAAAGVRLPLHALSPARLARAVSEAVACRRGAVRIAAAFEASGGAAAAATAVEGLIDTRPDDSGRLRFRARAGTTTARIAHSP